MMNFDVRVVSGKVRVKLPRNPDGTEYLRIDMSDGSFAFFPVQRDQRSLVVFPIKKKLWEPALWEYMHRKLAEDVAHWMSTRSPDPFDINTIEGHVATFDIGRPLNLTFDVTINQGGLVLPVTRRFSTAPITIADASAVIRERKAKKKKRNP